MKIDQFNAAVTAFATGRVPEEIRNMQHKLGIDGVRGLIEKTPVDTGRAKGGWQVGINNVPRGTDTDLDTNGTKTMSAAVAIVESSPVFSVINIVNNVVYILALEDGHSNQAKNGMLDVTVEELMQVFT